jgi:hypothetical protein
MASSVSFRKVAEKEGTVIFYSHPSKSDHNASPDKFISDIDASLSQLHGKQWILIVDADGFELKHSLGFDAGMKLATLLTEKYGESLVEIKFINPTWHLRSIVNLVWPFLATGLKAKINIVADKCHSILEYI